MSQQLYIDFSVARKILMVALCLLLVFMLAAKPMTVHASATAVVVGAAGSVVSVAPWLIPVILLCIAVGVYWDDIGQLVQRAKDIYNTASTEAKLWFQNVGDKYLSGSRTVSIPDYIKDVFSGLNEALFPSLMGTYLTLVVSELLRDLRRVTSEQLLSDSYLESLAETNSLLGGMYDVISGVRSAVISIPSLLSEQINFVVSETGIRMQEYAVALAGLSDAIDYRIDQLTTYVRTEVLYAIREGYVSLGSGVATLNADLYYAIDQLTLYMRTEVLDNIRGVSINITNSIRDLEAKIKDNIDVVSGNIASLGVTIKQNIDVVSTKIDELIGAVSNIDVVGSVQGVLSPGIATDAFEGVLAGVGTITDFFNPSGSGSDEDLKIPLWPYFDTSSSVWSFFADSEFISALTSFFNFVAALWVLFPLGIRYLIMFGFCFPFMFAGVKMLVG